MFIKTSKEELDKRIKLHETWFKDNGYDRLNLQDYNLSKANLSEANLSEANLRGSNLILEVCMKILNVRSSKKCGK